MSRTTQHDDTAIAVTSGTEGRQYAQVPKAFLQHSGAQPAARCVMVSLCLYADSSSGRTTALSQLAIANAAGVSRETVTRCIAWLEDEGWVEVYEPVKGRDERGRLPMRIYSVAPAWRRERERFAEENAPRMQPRKRVTSDDRSPVGDLRSPVTTDHRCAQITEPVTTDHRTGDERSQRTDQGTDHSDAAAASATVETVIGLFNDLTGGSWTPQAYRVRLDIILAAHPELTLADHRRIIERQLAAPYWQGPARPNHVYRDLEQFERCIADAQHNPPATTPAAAAPADGLEAWERDALQRHANSGVDAHLHQIDQEGSPTARAAAAAARAKHQEVAA